ncbi:hypothetical protein [Halalkalibacter urbisdiaboli]|uniref:hypothetical protein n=1 Tax=Halalkalibacter urbisdiaboli TaxID=1960589 RepID=UPI000B43A127|nr:hypothetical protein [Halalkalibacter urbisdiaboli]
MKLRLFLLCAVLMTACTGQKYEKEDTIAVLNGEEIKVEDVLWQFSLEKETENIINMYLKQEVVIQESKDKGITVSEDEVVEKIQALFPSSEPIDRFEFIDDKTFYEQQASLLGVSSVKYFEVWEDITYTKQAYVEKYIDKKIGEPTEEDLESWGQMIDEHINELFDTYKREGKLEIH